MLDCLFAVLIENILLTTFWLESKGGHVCGVGMIMREPGDTLSSDDAMRAPTGSQSNLAMLAGIQKRRTAFLSLLLLFFFFILLF